MNVYIDTKQSPQHPPPKREKQEKEAKAPLTCALIIALRLSCSAFSTTNLALSASCAATCLASIAAVNSFPKVRLVIDTSSRAMLNWAALSVKTFRISLLTAYGLYETKFELKILDDS